ncbi:hypothetical protein, partial [Pseudoalteromonas maricaloris]|uniref:hypothetical protein n=1 Tax=Pseudoalteromonas maricaloris TaxID=184924 RepID=UPI003C192D91
SRPENASLNRSQFIDLFASKNGFAPSMFRLSQKQQIEVGNQITNLLFARLGSYEKVSELIDKTSDITLKDLGIEKQSTTMKELEFLMSGQINTALTSNSNVNKVASRHE